MAFTLRTGSSCNGCSGHLETRTLKSAAGVATGSITNAGGATDAQVTIQFRLNSTLAKKELRKALFKK
jgi:hypothetical protein